MTCYVHVENLCVLTSVGQVHGAAISPAEIVVVSEFVEGGTLRDLLDKRRERLNIRCITLSDAIGRIWHQQTFSAQGVKCAMLVRLSFAKPVGCLELI